MLCSLFGSVKYIAAKKDVHRAREKNDIRNPDFSGNMVKLVEWIMCA